MNPQQESALEICQRAENMLREIQNGELVPGTEMLAQWETELGQVAALLEATYGSMTDEFKPRNNPAVREAILRDPAAGRAAANFSSNTGRTIAWACCKYGWDPGTPRRGCRY